VPELVSDYVTFIRWITNQPGGSDVHFGIVHYGTDPKDLSQTAKSEVRVNRGHAETMFRVRIEALKPRTTYYYKVTSIETVESDGVESPISQFTTPAPASESRLQPSSVAQLNLLRAASGGRPGGGTRISRPHPFDAALAGAWVSGSVRSSLGITNNPRGAAG